MIPINRDRFEQALNYKNESIRGLGRAYVKIQRNEKTIRRYLKKGQFPEDTLNRVAQHLNVTPKFLTGYLDERVKKITLESYKEYQTSLIKPENYPYLLHKKEEIDYPKYFEMVLTNNNISQEQFKSLDPMERTIFHQELALAITKVFANHFLNDSLGNDLARSIEYMEVMEDDFDPTSYFAHLEGVGIEEPDFSDGEISEPEQSLIDKYGI